MGARQATNQPFTGGAAHADRLRRLHALANPSPAAPRTETHTVQHEARAQREGDSYRFDAAARSQATMTVVDGPTLSAARAQAEAAATASVRAQAAGQTSIGALALRGAAGLEAEGTARAAAEGFALVAPQLVAAQGTLLAEAAARIRAAAVGQAQLGPSATATGMVSVDAELVARAQGNASLVATPTSFDAQAEASAEAYARARGEVAGEVALKDQKIVGAALAGETVTGTKTKAKSGLHLGIDQFGLPSFGIGAAAEAVSGAWSKAQAKGFASILGLIQVGASGSAEALAGVGAGLDGVIAIKDGAITLGAGAKAAAGVGGGAGATLTVGLGNLPKGVIQTVGAPILPIPGLLINTVSKGIRALTGGKKADPAQDEPGIEDLPKVVASNFTNGIKLIGKGAEEIADQAATAGGAIVDGVVSLGRSIGKGIASLFD
ncbi:hypothetical protein D3C86_1086140 [compost metagenome]